jgi:glutamate/tyrosine decarboxylase-like PLP-dependent enzyme
VLDKELLDRTAEIAREFLERLPERHAGAEAGRAELLEGLDLPLPQAGTDSKTVIDDLAQAVGPGLIASAGPRYFGFVIGGSTPPAIAADWLTSAWDQNAGIYAASPAASVVEEVTARWVVELLRLPTGASVGFVTGGQMGNFTGLAVGRHATLAAKGWDVEAQGLRDAPPLRLFVGEEAHVTVIAAARLLGLGADSIVQVGADGQGRMKPTELARQLTQATGPSIVCAQVGNVNSGAIDPVGEIAEVAHSAGAWCHVDGAFGLWAAVGDHHGDQLAGVENADSWVTDAHKWLNVPYDCSLAIVRDPEVHRAVMGVSAPYLPAREPGERSPEEWVPELSRRARATPVYAAIRSLGREGIAVLVENGCERAAQIAGLLAAEPGIEVLNDVDLNQVLVRFSDDDGVTERVIEAVQQEGTCWVAGTTWQGRAAMRISITNWATSPTDITRSAAAICAAAHAERSDA